MEPTNRRTFLRNAGIAAGAAAAVTAVPASAAHAASAIDRVSTPDLPEGASDTPVVAFVRDVRKGKVVLYTGEQETVITDKRLASLLYRATR